MLMLGGDIHSHERLLVKLLSLCMMLLPVKCCVTGPVTLIFYLLKFKTLHYDESRDLVTFVSSIYMIMIVMIIDIQNCSLYAR